MIQLSTSYSQPLVELVHAGAAPIDAVQVGEYFSVAQVRQAGAALPGYPLHFHSTRAGVIPGTLGRFKTYLRYTQTTLASVHIALLPSHILALALRFGWRLPSPNPEKLTGAYIERIKRLKAAIPLPLLLENMPALPHPGYAYESDPARLTAILEATDCGLLLDLTHARTAAPLHGLEVHDYLARLPLQRVRQIHTSGPRMQGGHLRDAHAPLEAPDYALLEWALARTQPQIVTLEYHQAREPLQKQLEHLRTLIRSHLTPTHTW